MYACVLYCRINMYSMGAKLKLELLPASLNAFSHALNFYLDRSKVMMGMDEN